MGLWVVESSSAVQVVLRSKITDCTEK